MGQMRAFVEASPNTAVTTPAQTSVGTTAGLLLAANAKRKGFWIQNTADTILKVTLGTTMPTQTAYHVALAACSAADDGLGATYFESNWVGPVNIISSAVGGACVVVEIETGQPDWNRSGDWGIS